MTFAGIITVIVFGLSLCADCFAVSLCSSVTLRRINWSDVLKVAFSFAVIQTGFLVIGYEFGNLLSGVIEKFAHYLGFGLLGYVGGSMIAEGARGAQEAKDLNGWKNIILGGIATSIDALAVGVSMSCMSDKCSAVIVADSVSVFVCTALSVIVGIWGGKTIGSKVGSAAEIVGGLVLIGIGISILFK